MLFGKFQFIVFAIRSYCCILCIEIFSKFRPFWVKDFSSGRFFVDTRKKRSEYKRIHEYFDAVAAKIHP